MTNSKWCFLAIVMLLACNISCGDENERDDDDINSNASALDIAPQHTKPGVYGGEGCPESDLTADEFNAGEVMSQRFDGSVTGADGHGRFYIRSKAGQEIAGRLNTDADTEAYAFQTPLFCGEQLMKLKWSNEKCDLVVVKNVNTENCVEPDVRITLLWDDQGQDWELHLIKEGGQINNPDTDCTWNTCINKRPDWGVTGDASDDPFKDVDNTGILGPENIILSKPEAGTYTVMVEHWANGNPDSSGRVIFNITGQPTTVADFNKLAPKHVWTAGTIDWPSGKVTTSNDVFDCSDSWSNGCTATIP